VIKVVSVLQSNHSRQQPIDLNIQNFYRTRNGIVKQPDEFVKQIILPTGLKNAPIRIVFGHIYKKKPERAEKWLRVNSFSPLQMPIHSQPIFLSGIMPIFLAPGSFVQ